MGSVPLQVPEAVQVSICYIKYLHKHMGSVPLHFPEAVQVRFSVPMKMKPGSHW